MRPRVLVLDEASAMLDPRGRAGLMRVCRELHDAGMTIVMITHYMEEAALADRVVVLDAGKIALEGTPADVLARAAELERLNLEVPPSCRLGLALQRRGVPIAAYVDERDAVHCDRAARERGSGAAGTSGCTIPSGSCRVG